MNREEAENALRAGEQLVDALGHNWRFTGSVFEFCVDGEWCVYKYRSSPFANLRGIGSIYEPFARVAAPAKPSPKTSGLTKREAWAAMAGEGVIVRSPGGLLFRYHDTDVVQYTEEFHGDSHWVCGTRSFGIAEGPFSIWQPPKELSEAEKVAEELDWLAERGYRQTETVSAAFREAARMVRERLK